VALHNVSILFSLGWDGVHWRSMLINALLDRRYVLCLGCQVNTGLVARSLLIIK
jgi:hypothetical protein